MRRAPSSFTVKVVGMTFVAGYPDSVHRLKAAADRAALTGEGGEGLAVVLRRNPDNPHDANAIVVEVPAAEGPVGHVPAHLAARLAPELDAGARWRCSITEVLVHPDHLDRPGITLACERVVP